MGQTMSRFVLIEQSLNKVGGHFFEYSINVLRAAEEAGYEPVLALNEHFDELELIPSHWQVLPCFRHSSGRIHRISSRSAEVKNRSRSLLGWADQVFGATADRFKTAVSDLRYWRRWKRIRAFSEACHELFDTIDFQEGDQIFCSTMADMDLLGLVRFLEACPKSQDVQWHLQFHFSIYYGRDPEYTEQTRKIQRLTTRFRKALQRVPNHRLHFYTTTDHLTRQFNSLGVADFQTMHWAVGRRFHFQEGSHARQSVVSRNALQTRPPSDDGSYIEPLKLYCPGGVRREKGTDRLSSLIEAIDEDLLSTNKVQLVFQTDQRRRAESIVDLPKQIPILRHEAEMDQIDPQASIVSLPFPLETARYAEAIRQSDIGLLLYQSDDYFARCSGILLELLTAGVPVIVPAGCWLSDQIETINAQYIRSLAEANERASWTQSNAEIECPPLILKPKLHIDEQVGNVVVRLHWKTGVGPGQYARIELLQLDEEHRTVARQALICSCRATESTTWAAFEAHPQAHTYQLGLANAYGQQPLPVCDVSISWCGGESQPISQIGLAIADFRQVPWLISEIVQHYSHYRQSAQLFSRKVIEQHDPSQTIRRLSAA